jgi:hypothetical protein
MKSPLAPSGLVRLILQNKYGYLLNYGFSVSQMNLAFCSPCALPIDYDFCSLGAPGEPF